jgi:hypothetical protein
MAEVESGDHEFNQPLVLQEWLVNSRFLLPAHQAHSFPFSIQLPFETPITEVACRRNGARVWIQTHMDVDWGLDATDRDYLKVLPTPAMQIFLQAMQRCGFVLSTVDVEKGQLTARNFRSTIGCYQELEFEDKIGEVSFNLESVTVSVTERKLRAQWSPELAQDVAAFHNIDAEAELTALLSEQVAAEIDREILRDLRKGAAWTLRWDYNGWKRLNNQSTPYTQKDWNQTLITAINQISAQIHKSTLRGGANWIVVSSEVSAIFDDLQYFHVSNAAPEQDQYNMGIERVGTLAGRYQVYRDPYFPPNTVLLGHKGTSLLDTGYIYAPYVPLQLTPTMYNPFNFTPIKGIMTRYAKKVYVHLI